MGKKAKNNSRRIKTSHKKGIIKRKTAYTHVDKNLLDVNQFINRTIEKAAVHGDGDGPKIEAESMSFNELRRLLDGPPSKKRMTKLSVDDANYLEPLVKKYGTNYERAAKDIKLNRMQWTGNQIAKKWQSYNLLLKEDQN
jgi:DNA-binding Lrp family transcriptional regulator